MKHIRKMSFDQVDQVFESLDYSFHPKGVAEGEQLDDRFNALWTIFLSYSGWSEEEYWEAKREDCECEVCEAEKEDEAEVKAKTDKGIN